MIESRLRYYLNGSSRYHNAGRLSYSSQSIVVNVDSLSANYKHFEDINAENNNFLESCFNHQHFIKIYCDPVSKILSKFGINKTVKVAIGDNRSSFDCPTIVKSRARDASNCILFKLNSQRHWDPCSQIRLVDIRFKEKIPAVCWRGVTTGVWRDDVDSQVNSPRFHLMKHWLNIDASILNLGLTKFTPSTEHKLGPKTRDMIQNFIREHLTLSQQLKYRYILSLEGNDVATNLKWIMCSNSIPVMPTPTAETWAMELTLEPWINYVPIKHDTSDLLDVINTAENNKPLMKQIRANNKKFMKKFFKDSSEEKLMAKILMSIK